MSFTTKMTEQYVQSMYQKATQKTYTKTQNKDVIPGQKDSDEAAVYEGSVNPKKNVTYQKPLAVTYKNEKKDDLQAKLDKTYEALSEEAKDYLATLKEKFGDIDFFVADCATDEEMSRYFQMGSKKYSCVISSSLIEKMATDEEARTKYEAIIDGADEQMEEMKEAAKEELGENEAKKIEYVGFTIDDNGVVNYFARLKTANESYHAKLKEKRAEAKEEEKKAKQEENEKKAQEKKEEEKQTGHPKDEEFWVKSDSKEGLIEAIRKALGLTKKNETPDITMTEVTTEE